MTKLIAVHYLQLGSGVKGVIDEIAPGKAFMARDDELFLVERGAARKPRADEKDMTVVNRAVSEGGQAQVTKLAADDTIDDEGTGEGNDAPVETDLADMTKAQLIEFAKAEEIEIDEKANKPVILETIQAALAARSGDGLI